MAFRKRLWAAHVTSSLDGSLWRPLGRTATTHRVRKIGNQQFPTDDPQSARIREIRLETCMTRGGSHYFFDSNGILQLLILDMKLNSCGYAWDCPYHRTVLTTAIEME